MDMFKEEYAHESKLMQFFRRLGLDSIAWPLRRLHCPVARDALVLEVGSGGSPYFRANVLCDAYEESEERFFAPLVCDRPMVISFAERLPFKDDAFDFVIASHVLEHSADPDRFLGELQRVAKAGYIEVPDAFMERLTHYAFHRLEITDGAEGLIIRKKKGYIQDQEVVALFHNKVRHLFPKWVARFPFEFHVRHYWSRSTGGIRYKIINPDCDATWPVPQLPAAAGDARDPLIAVIKRRILATVRRWMSQNRRNASIDLISLLQCSTCGGGHFDVAKDSGVRRAVCRGCGSELPIPAQRGH